MLCDCIRLLFLVVAEDSNLPLQRYRFAAISTY
jgi:hypothetical protein